MSKMFKERTMDKYYLAVVSGYVDSYHDHKRLFKVRITKQTRLQFHRLKIDGDYIETAYEPLEYKKGLKQAGITVLKSKTCYRQATSD